MNIVLCTDEKYAMPCGVCITSILENNKSEECNIYVLTKDLKQSTVRHFEQLSACYSQQIKIVRIDAGILKGLKVSNRFREAIYYRFLIPDIVPANKALYLDSDIIVTNNLSDIWNTDLSGYACAVVEDQTSDDIRLHNRIEMYSTYFNSGVLLMNLDYWRTHNLKVQLIDYIYNNPERCLYPDQDAMNLLLENKVLFLDYKYNYQDMMRLPHDELLLHRSKWEQAHKYLTETPTIIHYTSNMKPWHVECKHDYKKFFLHYKKKSPWRQDRLRRNLSFRVKCYKKIVRLIRKMLFLKSWQVL